MKKLLLVLPLFLLFGCEQREPIETKQMTVEVVSVHLSSKSNSKVTLRDVATGTVYDNQRLSCTKNKASNVKIGSKWDVYADRYRFRGAIYTDIAARGICTLSQ